MLFCGANGKVFRHFGVQMGGGIVKNVETHCGASQGSYNRDRGRFKVQID